MAIPNQEILNKERAPEVESDPEIPSKMLVDYCSKVCATALGDSHREMVLGVREDGTYQIDIYVKELQCKEWHKLHVVPKECYDEVSKYIKKARLAKYKNKKGFPLCGGDTVVKFLYKDKEYIRLSSENMKNMKLLQEVGEILGKYL